MGYVVDIGLTPQKIADKFGLDVEELLELNADLVKGTGKNRRFEAGSVIKLPGEFSPINTNLVNMRSQAEVQADVATRAQKRQEAKDKVDNMQVITIEQLVGHGYKLRNNFGVRNARELAIMVGNINYAVENGGFNNDEYSMSCQEMNGKCNFTEYELNALTRKIIELNPDLFNTDGTLKYTNHTDKQGKWLVIGSGKYEDMTLQLPATPAMVGETERVQTEQIDRVAEWNVSRAESDGKNIALQVNKAVVNGGSGTDEDLLNSTLARIDSNSVAYAVINYKEQYSEGIMEAIYGDDTEIARKYRDKIVSSLIAKAKELGIDCSNLEYVFVNNKNIYTNAMNSPTWQDESFLDLAYRIQAVENTPVSQRASVLESEITTRTVESAMGDADILADQAWDALKAQHKRNGWTGWTINGIKSITGGTTYGDVESEVLQFMVSLSDCERAYFGVAFEDLQAKYNSLNQQKLDGWNWNILKDTYLENGSDAFKAKYKELTGTELSDDVFNQMETAFIKGLETKGVEAFKKQYETEFGVEADPQMLGAYNLQMQQFTYAKTYEGLSRVFKGYDEKSQEELVALMNEYFPNQEVDYSQYSKEDLVNAIRISLKELKTASGGRKSDDIRADMLNSAKALFPEYADVMDKVLDYNSSQELTKGCFKMGLNIVAAVVVGFLTAGPAGAAAGAKMALSTGTIVVAGVSAATNLGDLAVREIAGDDVSADEWFQATLNVGLDAVMFNGPIKYSRYVDEIADLTKLQKAGKLVAFDASTGIAGDFVREGELTVDGVIYNLVFSGVNLIGLCKKGAPESETIVLPTLDNAVHNPHTSVGMSNVSSVRVGARKAEAITAEIVEFIENGNASVDDLVRVRAEVESISNRDLRRSSVTKLNDYIATLPPEQQAQFKQGFTAHLQQRVDGVLSSNKPFMPEDVRLIKEYADNIDDINVLNQLKENILAKQKTSRGAHYDEALSVVDKRINKIKSTPEATPARPVEEPETHTTIGAEVANRDVSIATGARAVDDVQVAREAVDDIDVEVSASSNLPLKQAWQSCKTKIDELLAYTGQITDALKVKLKGALAELDTLISTASGTLKTKFEALKASLIAKFNGLKNNGLRNVDFSRNMSREEIIEEITYRFSRSDVALPQEMIDDFIKNFDFENKTVHLENLATIFNSKCSADLFTLCNERGFFSSKQNGELLDFVLFKCEKLFKNQGLELFNKFDNNQLALIKNRNIISDNLDLVDYKVKLSDEDYNRLYVDGPYAGKLPYISENDYVNEIILSCYENVSDDLFKSLKKLDNHVTEFLKNIDESDMPETISFLKQFISDNSPVEALTMRSTYAYYMEPYNKAYEYLRANNLDANIHILRDINTVDLHKLGNNKKTVLIFDSEGNLIKTVNPEATSVHRAETITTTNGSQEYRVTPHSENSLLIDSSTKIVKDENGNLLYIEEVVLSDVPNKYNIKRTYPYGSESTIGTVERSFAGDLMITKTLEGPNGTKTNYNYIESPEGSKLSITQIVDKDGNVIFENHQSFKVIDENHFKTVENGVEYDIQYNIDANGNGTVKVTRGDGEVVELAVGENDVATISKDMLPLLKQMPGSFYFDIKNYGLGKIGKGINNISANNAHYSPSDNLISMSDELSNEIFTLGHEFGHYRDNSFGIVDDNELMNIFREERASLLMNENSIEAQAMDYFITSCSYDGGTDKGSLGEIIAETNALLYMNNSFSSVELRGMYLQQYFPKTFARAAELLQKPIPIVEPIEVLDIVSAATPVSKNPVSKTDQLTRVNTYEEYPNANLVDFSYSFNGKNYVIKVPEGLPKQKLADLVLADKMRRTNSEIYPQFAELSDADQMKYVNAYIKEMKNNNMKFLGNMEALLKLNNDSTNLSRILNDTNLFVRTVDDIAELRNLLPKMHVQLAQKVYGGLIDLKQTNPERFQKILDTGIFEMIKGGKLSPKVLSRLNAASDLSPQVYADLALVKQGKSIVPEFPAGTNLDEAFAQTKVGDAVEVGNKMYLNDGNTLIEWNMTKEKYLELFPPVERFATCQGSVGNCHLVQTMVLGMNNPKARVDFLQSFSLNGDDVVVTVKGLEDYKGSLTFPNGEIVLSSDGKHLTGCKGMQMYEQTYSYVALRPEDLLEKNGVPDVPSIIPVEDITKRSALGLPAQTMADVFGKGSWADIPEFYSMAKEGRIDSYSKYCIDFGGDWALNIENCLNKSPEQTVMVLGKNIDFNSTDEILSNFANDTDYLLSFGTNPKPNSVAECTILAKYNLVSGHAYSIVGYDVDTKMVKFINPHSSAAVTEIPLAELKDHINTLGFLKL